MMWQIKSCSSVLYYYTITLSRPNESDLMTKTYNKAVFFEIEYVAYAYIIRMAECSLSQCVTNRHTHTYTHTCAIGKGQCDKNLSVLGL